MRCMFIIRCSICISFKYKTTVSCAREKVSIRWWRLGTETNMARFDWLYFTDKCLRANQIWLYFIRNHVKNVRSVFLVGKLMILVQRGYLKWNLSLCGEIGGKFRCMASDLKPQLLKKVPVFSAMCLDLMSIYLNLSLVCCLDSSKISYKS